VATSVNIPDQDRILTFLSLLDDDVAEHTLRAMDPELAKQLRGLLSEPAKRKTSAKTQRQVLDEFGRFFRFARKFSNPPVPVQRAKKEVTAAIFEPSDDSIDDLENMNVYQLTSALEEESPRTTAILLQELSTDRTAEILGLMRSELRNDVVRELTLSPKAPRILVEQVARSTCERAAMLPPERLPEPDPVQRMAEVLRSTEKKLQKEMLKTLMDQDADMTARIQKLLFRFEDLTEMDDTQVSAVLGKVETSTIATALYQADQKILDKVMGNLSKRARETLEEELSFLSRVPETQIKTARETVGEAIAEVEMESE
jgi:flagellar motor switch protein FliG